jgi:hypothetical protein
MNDTARIPRPFFCRRIENRGGRLIVDPDGSERRVRTRFDDTTDAETISLIDTGVHPVRRPRR